MSKKGGSLAKNIRLVRLGLVQALGVAGYCGLVGLLFWRGNQWFGKVPNYLGPLLFLLLFATSALVCAVLALGYPAILIWKKKQPIQAVKLAGYTAAWLVGITLVVIGIILVRS